MRRPRNNKRPTRAIGQPGRHNGSSPTRGRYQRRLRCECLEGRWLLALTVDTLIDEADGSLIDGDISLRDALAAAAPGETIDFHAALAGATITLTLGELAIAQSVLIDASNLTSRLTIDATGNDPTPGPNHGDGSRVFRVDDGDSTTAIDVELRRLTLIGGDVAGNGGAILSLENLTIVDSVIAENAAALMGGGVWIGGGTAAIRSCSIERNKAGVGAGLFVYAPVAEAATTIADSTISGNSAFVQGGGIAADAASNGTVTIMGSTITANWTRFRGGGAWMRVRTAGAVTVTSSVVDANSARFGGGVYALVQDATTTINESTVSNNSALITGGGLWSVNSGGTMTIGSSTISENRAASDGGGSWTLTDNGGVTTIESSTVSGNSAGADGGGVYATIHDTSTLDLLHSTISGNLADVDENGDGAGGGVFAATSSTNDPMLDHTILAGNRRGLLTADDAFGTFNAGFSLIETTVGATIYGMYNVLDQAALLGPLSGNGGATRTHPLLPGSPAIDAGEPVAAPDIRLYQYDQRGAPFGRYEDGNGDTIPRIDIGAFELQAQAVRFDQPLFQTSESAAVSMDVTLSRESSIGDSHVRVEVIGGTTGAADFDMTIFPLTVAFQNGESTKTLSIPIQQDLLIEGTEAIELGLTAVWGAATGNSNTTILELLDDDSAQIEFLLPASSRVETDALHTVTVRLAAASGVEVGPGVALTADVIDTQTGSATMPDDYLAFGVQTVVFASGALGGDTHVVTLEFRADTVVELDEDVHLILTNVAGPGVELGPQSEHEAIIANDDSATVSIGGVTQQEKHRGTSTFSFTVSLDGAVDVGVDVPFTTANGTAEDENGDGDYQSTVGTVHFAGLQGEMQSILVSVNGDRRVEPDESFLVQLLLISAAGRAVTLADGEGLGTIVNDDPACAFAGTMSCVSDSIELGGRANGDESGRDSAPEVRRPSQAVVEPKGEHDGLGRPCVLSQPPQESRPSMRTGWQPERGRESFSAQPDANGLPVGRKRLPTPFMLVG